MNTDIYSRLSDDEIYEQLIKLPVRDILKLRFVNKRLYQLISDDKFWCRIIKRDYNVLKKEKCFDWYKNQQRAKVFYLPDLTDKKKYKELMNMYVLPTIYTSYPNIRFLYNLNEFIDEKKELKIKRGDILSIVNRKKHMVNLPNDNRVLFIYDGKNFIALEHVEDGYGRIPHIFDVDEFPNVRYWDNILKYDPEDKYKGLLVPHMFNMDNFNKIKILDHNKKVGFLIGFYKSKYNIYFLIKYKYGFWKYKKNIDLSYIKKYIVDYIQKYKTMYFYYNTPKELKGYKKDANTLYFVYDIYVYKVLFYRKRRKPIF